MRTLFVTVITAGLMVAALTLSVSGKCAKDQVECNGVCHADNCTCCVDNCYLPVGSVCCLNEGACPPGNSCCLHDGAYWCCDEDSVCCPKLWTCCPAALGCGKLDCGVDHYDDGLPAWARASRQHGS